MGGKLRKPRVAIQSMSDGTQYVEVDTDQDIFDGVPLSEYSKVVAKYIRDHFRGTPILEGTTIRTTAKSANEYAGRRAFMDDSLFEAKGRAAAEIGNMMRIAIPVALGKQNTKQKHKDTISWDYYKVIFRVNGRWFEGIINIKNRQYDRIFYDMKPVRDITDTRGASYSIMTGDVSTDSVAQNQQGNNGQTGQRNSRKSLAAMDREYMAEVERGIGTGRMVRQAAKAAGAVLDEFGQPLKLYHGTPSFGFTVFGPEGSPIFLSSNRGVASGYRCSGS